MYDLDFFFHSSTYARNLSQTAGTPITYTQSDVRLVANTVSEQIGWFDMNVNSNGMVTLLPDMNNEPRSIALLLKDVGIFMIRDSHPCFPP